MGKDHSRNSWAQGSDGIACKWHVQDHTIGLSRNFQNSSGEQIHVIANAILSRIRITYIGLN